MTVALIVGGSVLGAWGYLVMAGLTWGLVRRGHRHRCRHCTDAYECSLAPDPDDPWVLVPIFWPIGLTCVGLFSVLRPAGRLALTVVRAGTRVAE